MWRSSKCLDHADLARRLGNLGRTTTGMLSDEPTSIAIWTTTPWTLPANRAVALHPQFTYSLVEFELGDRRERLLLADELVASVMQALGVTHLGSPSRRPRAKRLRISRPAASFL